MEWFIQRYITRNMHSPVDVFNAAQESFNKGKQPVLNVFEKYGFGGIGHTLKPIALNTSVHPWIISVRDPNTPKVIRQLTVDPDANWYTYMDKVLGIL
jgi:hypothetical protein